MCTSNLTIKITDFNWKGLKFASLGMYISREAKSAPLVLSPAADCWSLPAVPHFINSHTARALFIYLLTYVTRLRRWLTLSVLTVCVFSESSRVARRVDLYLLMFAQHLKSAQDKQMLEFFESSRLGALWHVKLKARVYFTNAGVIFALCRLLYWCSIKMCII